MSGTYWNQPFLQLVMLQSNDYPALTENCFVSRRSHKTLD